MPGPPSRGGSAVFVRTFAIVLALAVAPFAAAADEENPYKKVKVGDYATYKLTGKAGGMALEGSLTQTVSAKSDKEATIKVTSKVNGMDVPSQEQKIDLTKPYDPTKAVLPEGTEAKIEKVKDGKEKIKAGGKEYDCTWETYKVKAKANGMEIEAEMKLWQSKDLPLLVVKMEMTAETAGMKIETNIELTESGTKSD
jgi:hypothetical protein